MCGGDVLSKAEYKQMRQVMASGDRSMELQLVQSVNSSDVPAGQKWFVVSTDWLHDWLYKWLYNWLYKWLYKWVYDRLYKWL